MIRGEWSDDTQLHNALNRCPVKWKRRLGKEWCWSTADCTGVLDYFCGHFRGKSHKVTNDAGEKKEVDACELCVSYYVHRPRPIFNWQCFVRRLESTVSPYCQDPAAVSPGYLAKYHTFVQQKDLTWRDGRSALMAHFLMKGKFKDDRGTGVYTP